MRCFLCAPEWKKTKKKKKKNFFLFWCLVFFLNFKINFCTAVQKKFSLPHNLRTVATSLKGSAKQKHSRLKFSKIFQIIGTIANS